MAATGYTLTARSLHWLTAALVLIQIALGFANATFEMGTFLYNLHKSLGVVIWPIVAYRLIYRLNHPAPPLPADIPPIQQLAAHTVHWLLYGLLLIQPIVGWIGTTMYPAPVPIFGIFELPAVWPANRALSDQLMALHRWIGVALAGLLCAHIGGALFHHFIRRDEVLMRMVRG